MGGQDDLSTSLKAIMAARREGLGEPPTPDELLAYRDGLLAPEERQRIEAKLACHPDAARALADLLAFPNVEATPGTPEHSEEEIDARWQAFRQRLPERSAPVALESRAPALPEPRISTAAPVRRGRSALRLAAAALLGLGVGWIAGFAGRGGQDRLGPTINVQIAELAPTGATGLRSVAPLVELPGSVEELVLVLGGRASGEREFPGYEAELVNRQGRRIAARQGLLPTPLGTFQVAFRREALKPGRYRLDLFGRDRESRVHLATYELRLADRDEAR